VIGRAAILITSNIRCYKQKTTVTSFLGFKRAWLLTQRDTTANFGFRGYRFISCGVNSYCVFYLLPHYVTVSNRWPIKFTAT